MICPNCGNNNPDGANVCSACGAPQQPAQTVYAPAQPAKEKGKPLAIASLILGIVAFIVIPYIAGALAIVFGGVAKKQGCKSGMATAGIVLGIVAIVLQIVVTVFLASVINAIFSF